ncbi:hypothetical protein GP486_002195 [Trichoglossum hirsutum]|uniref:AAA+ ATPase domain-containing protein n=1 Tax=Trichoglossum hirsutum TaxID=265104 RepID=A0A9P8LFE3_9PEZI|nr:hypothetical protein GP486_002195 [Trichoglossum hirsutum]
MNGTSHEKSHARSNGTVNGSPTVVKVDMVHRPANYSPEHATNGTVKKPSTRGYAGYRPQMLSEGHDGRDGTDNESTTITTTTVFHVLRETSTTVVVQCKKELGAKAEGVLTGTASMDSLLDFIAAERLRSMPHQGSKWDKVLKWAESLARNMGEKTHVILLEKVIGILHQMGDTLGFFLRHEMLFADSTVIQTILAGAYADLIRLAVGVMIHYKKAHTKTTSLQHNIGEFRGLFGSIVDSFFHHRGRFSNEVWDISLKKSTCFQDPSITIRVLRKWLTPQDRTLTVILNDRLGTRTARHELTCEWFASSLSDFQQGKEDVLLVTGKSGSGKSVLTGWILERLKRTPGRSKPQEAISFTIGQYTHPSPQSAHTELSIDGSLRSQRSSLSVVKGLLLQLLEKNAGDLVLYKIVSAVYERTERQNVTEDLEPAIWNALNSALKSNRRNLMIVIDGLDQLSGGDTEALRLCERLHSIAKAHDGVKCILISRPLSKSCPPYLRHYNIESTNSHDINRFVEYSVSSSHEFQNLKDSDKQAIIKKICNMPNITFVWADLALQLLRREKSFDGVCKALESIPKTIPDLLRKLSTGLDFKQSDTKMIFSWLLVAERPLTLGELKSLIEIDIESCSQVPRFTSIEEDISTACGDLVKIQDGIVHFAHYSIKEYLLDLASSGKFPLQVADAHKELTTRILAYTKATLKDSHHEPTIDCEWDSSRYGSIQGLLQKHTLLEYSTRYWVSHFSKSSMYDKSKGKHVCSPEFRSCFPESSLLALIEGQLWETQTSSRDSIWRHSLALEVRKIIHGESHKSIIQCQVNLARVHQRCSSIGIANACYFDAWKTCRSVSGEKSSLAIACAKYYISCTESSTVKTRTEVTTHTEVTKHTEVMTHTEDIYRYIWTISKDIHGVAHEETIRYAKSLALLYTQLKKTEQATSIYREVYQACVEKYGHLHEETIITSHQLVTILKQTSKHDECIHITQSMLTVTEQTLEVWEQKRISATISLIETFESQKQLQKAEELLISMTRNIVEACRTRHEDHVHEAKIEITLQYVRFLKRHKREKEAEKILVDLWNDFKSPLHGKNCHGDGLLVRIRVIGEEMKLMKLVAAAESVFSSLWGYYKKVSQHTSVEATLIAISLSEILQTKSETHSEETILKEVFEATVSKTTTKTTIETTTVTTCTALSSFYERESRWSEAVHVCSKVLVSLWPSIEISGSSDTCHLPTSHHDEAIELARRLAICHHRERRIDKAESIHLHVFNACKSSLKFQDKRILIAARHLIKFYESERMIEKSIAVYTALWEEYRAVLGRSHDVSIRVTYDLARFCEQHQPTGAERLYLEIATALGCDNDELGAQSVEAVLALCGIYEREKRFRDAQNFYRKLWLTFCNRGKDCGIQIETVADIYHKYLCILEKQNDFSVVYDLTVQFKETCVKYYGTRHQLTIQATIQLAKVLERHESRREEAISIYEEVCEMTAALHKHTSVETTVTTTISTTTTITETTIIEVKERLARLYSAHTSTASKAEVIYYESWDKLKCKHGHAHAETLSCLSELISFFKRRNTEACIHTATETLQTTVVEIITKEKDTQKLFNSAEIIARLYTTLGLKDIAFELTREIRRQLAFTETKSNKKFKFQLRRGHTVDRRSFVFVMAFEETLNGNSRPTLFTEIMSDLMTETTLYESWMRSQKYGSSFEIILGIGARLSVFLKTRNREDESNKITDELWELFLSEMSIGETKRSGIHWELFLVCVTEMAVEGHDLTVIDAGATLVLSRYEAGAFESSFELATWFCKYIKSHGGFTSQQNLTIGFKLALCMAGRHSSGARHCQDQRLAQKMMELSKGLLKEVLKASEHEGMSFSSMPLEEVSRIVSLLGEQHDHENIERILTNLWLARKSRAWDYKTIIQIGLRLADVQAAHGHAHSAIDLLTDMAYNLQRVFTVLDPQTLTCYNHLSAIHTLAGHPHKSMAIHGSIIQAALAEDNNNAYADSMAKVIHDQLQLLKRSYQRHGKWDDEHGEEHYSRMWDECIDLFQERPVWNKTDNIRRWSAKGTPAGHKDLGCWHAPSEWGFLAPQGGKRYSTNGNGHVHTHGGSVRHSTNGHYSHARV